MKVINQDQQLIALLEDFQNSPIRALLAATYVTSRSRFWAGLSRLHWEWKRGSFSEREGNAIFLQRLSRWRCIIARSFEVPAVSAQVLNEFRNALTHLSRAAAAVDQVTLDSELGDVRRHLERATRDSYTIQLVYTTVSLARLTSVIHARYGIVPVRIHNDLRLIRDERRDILIHEHTHSSGSPEFHAITERYNKLVRTMIRWKIQLDRIQS